MIKNESRLKLQPRKWTPAQRDLGLDKAARRLSVQMNSQRDQERGYLEYAARPDKLLALSPADFDKRISRGRELIPKRAMGDANTVHDLQNYVVGPAPGGGF